ncbi:MAG: type II toxin-antitoxin system death-on-curing family toxin [Boseongicola sp. SB0677_bin_26]|nr:type II toxin-antitoxin system death-on-curing family toxin [Boseongicola sp. SB0665_bin_10]MYG26948.1 type II toxin-antitoxin system death-on-curing family toxin [Boseongicola sp. SB0677_bin_26]
MQMRRFGGASGLRDPGLLESAVARAAQILAYDDSAGVVEAACAIAEGLVRNHPFVDGNKRAAFSALATTLAANGRRLEMKPRRAAQLFVDLAANRLDADSFRALVRAASCVDPTAAMIEEISATEEAATEPQRADEEPGFEP